jgi:hypothetical protein
MDIINKLKKFTPKTKEEKELYEAKTKEFRRWIAESKCSAGGVHRPVFEAKELSWDTHWRCEKCGQWSS